MRGGEGGGDSDDNEDGDDNINDGCNADDGNEVNKNYISTK